MRPPLAPPPARCESTGAAGAARAFLEQRIRSRSWMHARRVRGQRGCQFRTEIRRVNSMARQFRPTWSQRGTWPAPSASKRARRAVGQQQATKPPLKASSTLSVSIWPAILARPAPSEVRIASRAAFPPPWRAADWPRSHTRFRSTNATRPAGPERAGRILSNQVSRIRLMAILSSL